jgi:hypothetical protein|tara:strand:- start:272 stop:451 length:180 start_codon:yes stop_codon:yes gene_type:complete
MTESTIITAAIPIEIAIIELRVTMDIKRLSSFDLNNLYAINNLFLKGLPPLLAVIEYHN